MIVYFNSLNDKIKHFLISAILTILITVVTGDKMLALIGVASIGIGKEAIDFYKGGVFDLYDIMADIFGIFIGFVIWEFTFRLWL